MISTFQHVRIASRGVYVAGLVASFAAVSSGCAGEDPSMMRQDRVGQAIQPIIRGTTSGTEHDAVVVLTNFRDGLRRNLCSATMVAPNLLLTARHCVSDTESSSACTDKGSAVTGAGVKADRPPGNLVVFVGKDGVVPNTEVEANGTARGSKLVVGSSTTICNADLAFLILDKKIDAPIAPIRLGPPSKDEKLSAIGWGVDETGSLPKQREIRTGLQLIGIGPGLYPDNPKYGYGDAEFMIGESACAGDSGGPTMSTRGAVVGIAARAGNGEKRDNNYASTCVGDNVHAVYTQIGAHEDLVIRAFREAGEPIWLEGEPDPRLPKPQGSSPNAPDGTPSTTMSGEGEASLPPAAPPGAAASAGGCSMTSEPQAGSVEYAAGLVALFATLIGLGRRLGRKDDSEDNVEIDTHHGPRARMPSLP